MKIPEWLAKKEIDPNMHILCLTAAEGVENIQAVLKEYFPHIDLMKFSKDELLQLLKDYSDCVSLYHPENAHQERAAILRNIKTFQKYGLRPEDISALEFY